MMSKFKINLQNSKFKISKICNSNSSATYPKTVSKSKIELSTIKEGKKLH